MRIFRRSVVGQTLPESCRVSVMEHTQGRPECKLSVVDQECVEQHGLVRKEKIVFEYAPRIVVGKVNIVKVDPTPFLKTGQDFEQQVINLTTGLHRVRRINEEKTPVTQIGRKPNVYHLGPFANKVDLAQMGRISEKRIWVGIDAGDLRDISRRFFGGHQHYCSGEARTNLDDASGAFAR